MTYLIDAWLERPHPCLRILHRETGEVCAVLDEEDLELGELNSSEPQILKEIVRNLFLFCYSRILRPGQQWHRMAETRKPDQWPGFR